jgi:PAS domain S-box-containing protein
LTFYAGFPLVSQDKLVIGALCLADEVQHDFTPAQIRTLQSLAAHVVSQIALNNKLAAVQRTVASLEDSEQRFRRIADASPVLLWISDPTGNRTLSNQAWCDFTGLSQEESLAECWRESVHPDDRSVYRAKWYECAKEAARFQHEFRLRHRSGTFRWVMEQAIPLFSSNGRLEAYVSSCVDLSLRSSDELQYQHNEARFRAVSEAAPLGIVVTDSNGNCIYSNHKFQGISGLGTEQSLGYGWLRTVHTEDYEELRTAWSEATKSSHSFERVFRYQHADGSIVWCSLKAAAINSTDTVSGWVCTIEDITTKRKVEADLVAAKQAAEAAMHSKSQFLANMSHEIRTPLTAIIGFADALRQENRLEPAQNHCLDVILNNGRHLLTIINQILDLSKIDAGALSIESSPCNVVDMIEELLLMFAPTVSEKSLALDVSYQWPLPRCITTDPLRLKQVLINLIGNAIKFTSKGSITIGVSWHQDSQQVAFSIADTGIGMSEEQCANLFTPFYQANDSITRMFGGTGLGLSISQRLIRALGGSIEVRSTPNVGSTFRFSIKSQDTTEEVFTHNTSSHAFAAKNRSSAPPSLSGRVLFADDALDNRRLVEHLVRLTGAEIVLVENGQEAIEVATRDHFDLILMDIQMPVVDGLSATRTIRESGVITPIVALSAGAMVSDVEKALAAGCSMHLSKPFERTTFYETLSRFVAQHPDAAHTASAPQACTEPEPTITSTIDPNDEEMQALLAEFIAGLAERIAEIRSSIDARDMSATAAHAHKLKGSAGMYGYPQLFQEAKTLEHAAKTDQKELLKTTLRSIDKLISQIANGFRQRTTSSTSHTPWHDQRRL